jgi:hypothetical protein
MCCKGVALSMSLPPSYPIAPSVRYMLTAAESVKYTLPFLASRIVKGEGLGALYRGLPVALLRNLVLFPTLVLFDGVHEAYTAARAPPGPASATQRRLPKGGAED